MNIIVVGGLSFIGKQFVKLCLDDDHSVINIDKCTYAADEEFGYDNFIDNEKYKGRYGFDRCDINDVNKIPMCDYLVNFDSSIGDNEDFIKTNVLGVRNCLEVIRKIPKYDRPVYIHISTDEVYSDIESGSYNEESPLKVSSPYAASKASGDLLVQSWGRTYGLKYLICRPCNNYGPRQMEEKLIPKTIYKLKNGLKIPVHGTGAYVREWCHTVDTSRAVLHLMKQYNKNDIYNIGTMYEMSNLHVIKKIYDSIEVRNIKYKNFKNCLEFVENRSGQDTRYSCNNSKLLYTGFEFTKDFDTEIKKIVNEPDVKWSVSVRDK